jgi:hypothetical protein
MYPIFTDPCEFQVLGLKHLPGIPEPVRALIEESQPYRCLPQAPTRDHLAILRTLSNIDKHRELAALPVAVEFEMIGAYGPKMTVREWRNATGKPLGHGTAEISSFIGVSETDADLGEMQMNPSFTYQVRIEGYPLDTLVVIAQRVYRSVTECETGKPLSPFATYPIYPGRVQESPTQERIRKLREVGELDDEV